MYVCTRYMYSYGGMGQQHFPFSQQHCLFRNPFELYGGRAICAAVLLSATKGGLPSTHYYCRPSCSPFSRARGILSRYLAVHVVAPYFFAANCGQQFRIEKSRFNQREVSRQNIHTALLPEAVFRVNYVRGRNAEGTGDTGGQCARVRHSSQCRVRLLFYCEPHGLRKRLECVCDVRRGSTREERAVTLSR